jgi:hypothetical protein
VDGRFSTTLGFPQRHTRLIPADPRTPLWRKSTRFRGTIPGLRLMVRPRKI